MDTSIIAALIGIFGTGAIGGLGFIFTGLRAGIRTNGERLDRFGERLDGFGERLDGFGERLDGFGERLARLEERFISLEERFISLEERFISEFGQIKEVLSRIEATQAEHGRQIEKLGGDLP